MSRGCSICYGTTISKEVDINTENKEQVMAVDKKLYVLDTNVLLHDPEAIFSFEHSAVGIPIMVLEELDTFKTESSQRGFNCREVIRHLDILRGRGSLSEGIST